MSYVLIEPKTGANITAIERAVDRLGYHALAREEFIGHISRFYTYQAGLGTNILLMTVISFVVGLSISGQTLYTFILENLERFGALKAIGAKGHELVMMIVFQATFVALVSYGLGIGLCTASITLVRPHIPDYVAMTTFANLILALAMVIMIAGISGYIGVCEVLRIGPFDIFRG